MKRPAEFDPQRAQVLLAYIRQGGFPFVAAEAAGVPAPTFHVWVLRGEQPGAREPLRGFAQNVRQAVAQARLLSELTVCKKDPKFWLSQEPGRETPDNAGWTTAVRPTIPSETWIDPHEQARTLCSLVLEMLTPFPEARAKVSERLVAESAKQAPRSQSASPSTPAFRALPPRWSRLNPSLN